MSAAIEAGALEAFEAFEAGAAAAGMSAAEIVFMRRMLPHVERGLSFDEAAAAATLYVRGSE